MRRAGMGRVFAFSNSLLAVLAQAGVPQEKSCHGCFDADDYSSATAFCMLIVIAIMYKIYLIKI